MADKKDNIAQWDAMQKQRMEKDLTELQSLIQKHFEQRTVDDASLSELTDRIEKRKLQRAEQIKVRQDREKERIQRDKEERVAKEAEDKRKLLEEEEKKKTAIGQMAQHYGGYLARQDRQRGGKRQTEREKKRKSLGERRKPLNIDHLNTEKLKDKAKELAKWVCVLEEERYDFEAINDRQKYDVGQLRQRVQDFMQKSGKGARGGKAVKTLANVGARASAFK